MAKKKIEDYRAQGAKFPLLAWALERGYIFVAFAVAALLISFGTLAEGRDALYDMSAEPEVEDPYQDLETRDFLGKRFAADFVSHAPDTVEDGSWAADDHSNAPTSVYSVEECPHLEEVDSRALLSTYEGTDNDDVDVSVMVFGAGHAKRYYEDATAVLRDCEMVDDFSREETSTDPEFPVAFFNENRAVFTAGDAVFEVGAPEDDLEDVVDFYAEYASESLQRPEWRCADLTPEREDTQRSFYYDFDGYRGLFQTDVLTNETPIDRLPVPVLTKEGNEEALQTIGRIADPEAEEPEAPLPSDFSDIPDEPRAPELPREFERVDEFSEEAYYEITDYTGPGCGWGWTSQVSPRYDTDTLNAQREEELTSTRDSVEQSARNYNDDAFHYAIRVMREDPVISRWNEYVDRVDSIHEDWEWLVSEREDLWPDWYQYQLDHEVWREFPGIQEEAQESYDDAVEQCQDMRDAVEEWEDEYGDAVRDGEAVISSAVHSSDDEDLPESYVASPVTEDDEDEEPESTPSPSPSPSPAPTTQRPSPAPSPSPTPRSTPSTPSPSPTPRSTPTTPSPSPSPSPTSPSPSPTETEEPEDEETEEPLPTVPPRPTDCSQMPDEPDILSQDRGDEPQAPSIPDGVTVPYSWDDPADSLGRD